MSELHRESADIVAGDGRTVTVQLAEWGEPRTVSDDGKTTYREAFESMEPAAKLRVKSSHDGELIGHAVADSYSAEPQPTIDLHLAETAAGNDTLALIQSGAIDAVSVEFQPSEADYTEKGVLHRVAAKINGIAMAWAPAHSAPILNVRELPEQKENPPMTEEIVTPDAVTAADLAAFGDDLKRDMVASFDHSRPAPEVNELDKFRTVGDLNHAILNGEASPDLYRALADDIIANSPGVNRPSWVEGIKQTVNFGRPTISAFGTVAVPTGAGTTVTWAVNANDESTLVGKQTTEKTDVTSAVWNVTSSTEELVTYSGAADISLQLLRRSSPAYLNSFYQAMYRGYAITTDTACAAAVVAAATPSAGIFVPGTGDASDLRAALFTASTEIENATNMPAAFVLVSSDVWGEIGKLDGLLPVPYGTSNVSGTATASSLQVNVSGLRVIHDRFLADGSIIVSNDSTGDWHEDGPINMEAADVAKAGLNAGVFGMGLFAAYVPAGIVKINAAAAAKAK